MTKPRKQKRRQYPSAPTTNTFSSYKNGSICWLKARCDLAGDTSSVASLPENCLNHPAVVLWTDGSKVSLFIVGYPEPLGYPKTKQMQITSFGGRPLEVRHDNNRKVRLLHLPISPSPRHPDTRQLLTIIGEPLRENSYVKIENVRVCGLNAIRPHGIRTLSKESYDLLLKHAPAKPASVINIPIPGIVPAYQRQIENRSASLLPPAQPVSAGLPSHHQTYNVHSVQWNAGYYAPARPNPSSVGIQNSYQTALAPNRTGHLYGTIEPNTRSTGTSVLHPSTPVREEQRHPCRDALVFIAIFVALCLYGAYFHGGDVKAV